MQARQEVLFEVSKTYVSEYPRSSLLSYDHVPVSDSLLLIEELYENASEFPEYESKNMPTSSLTIKERIKAIFRPMKKRGEQLIAEWQTCYPDDNYKPVHNHGKIAAKGTEIKPSSFSFFLCRRSRPIAKEQILQLHSVIPI